MVLVLAEVKICRYQVALNGFTGIASKQILLDFLVRMSWSLPILLGFVVQENFGLKIILKLQ